MSDEKTPIRLVDRTGKPAQWTPEEAIRDFLEMVQREREKGFEIDKLVLCYSSRPTDNQEKVFTGYYNAGTDNFYEAVGLLERVKYLIQARDD